MDIVNLVFSVDSFKSRNKSQLTTLLFALTNQLIIKEDEFVY